MLSYDAVAVTGGALWVWRCGFMVCVCVFLPWQAEAAEKTDSASGGGLGPATTRKRFFEHLINPDDTATPAAGASTAAGKIPKDIRHLMT
jgi:hypothetical protein